MSARLLVVGDEKAEALVRELASVGEVARVSAAAARSEVISRGADALVWLHDAAPTSPHLLGELADLVPVRVVLVGDPSSSAVADFFGRGAATVLLGWPCDAPLVRAIVRWQLASTGPAPTGDVPVYRLGSGVRRRA